jgi:nitrogen-specific signal transduction histidine kinase/CheY-like chemotaxis protein
MPNCLERDKAELDHLQPLGLLAGGIAHDFNNLLTAILGNASLAHKHRQSPEQLDIYLMRIQEASQAAAGLCKQMLAYAGKAKFSSGSVHVSKMIKDMSQLLEVSLTKGVTIAYDLAENLPYIQMEPSHMQQLLMNLIMNANEAMQQLSGNIKLSTGTMLVDEQTTGFRSKAKLCAGTYVYIEVMDDGCGMDMETQHKLFDPFFTTKGEGHGLGMSNILNIVCGHQGMIKVVSEPKKGTRVKIAFPAILNQNQDDNIMEEYDALNKIHLGGKILLVDDEEVVLETMQVMLEDLGCETLLAQDGEQAIAMYKQYQHEIALVLLDFTMPKMSGQACVSALQAMDKHVKIILCSGYSEEDIRSRCDASNVAGFLPKPCDLRQLHHALKQIL